MRLQPLGHLSGGKPGKDDSFPEGYRIAPSCNSRQLGFISFYGQGRGSANRQKKVNKAVEREQEKRKADNL